MRYKTMLRTISMITPGRPRNPSADNEKKFIGMCRFMLAPIRLIRVGTRNAMMKMMMNLKTFLKLPKK